MKAFVTKRVIPLLPLAVLVLAAASPVIYSSCTPGSGITAAESDVVVTLFDNKFDFGSVFTFAPPDTILHVTTEGVIDNDENLSRTNDQMVLNLIKSNMEARGYIAVTPADDPGLTDPPDVAYVVYATSVQNYQAYVGYPWWGGYPGYPWWGCCWGPSYPPAASVSYAYTAGTLFIQLMDPEDVPGDQPSIAVPWNAAINGVLDDSAVSKQQRLTDAVNQAFDQSPYIKTTQPSN